MSYTDAQMIAAHIRINDTLKAEEAAWDARRKQLNNMLQSLEGALNARILAMGGDINSISTEEGTVFNRLQTFVSVSDKEALKDYVEKTRDTSFLDWDVSRKGVESYIEKSGGHAPPGVRVTKIIKTIVRK